MTTTTAENRERRREFKAFMADVAATAVEVTFEDEATFRELMNGLMAVEDEDTGDGDFDMIPDIAITAKSHLAERMGIDPTSTMPFAKMRNVGTADGLEVTTIYCHTEAGKAAMQFIMVLCASGHVTGRGETVYPFLSTDGMEQMIRHMTSKAAPKISPEDVFTIRAA